MRVKLLKKFRREFYIKQDRLFNGEVVYTGCYGSIKFGYISKYLYNKWVFDKFLYRAPEDYVAVNSTRELREVFGWHEAIAEIKRFGLELFLAKHNRYLSKPETLKRNIRKNKTSIIYGRNIK